MLRFIAGRLLHSLLTLLVAVTIVFILGRASGSPVMLMIGDGATPDQVAYLEKQLGLNRPYYEQYFVFLANTIRGDFGDSIQYSRSALDITMKAFPNTVKLVLASLGLAVFVSIILGVVAAVRRNSIIDKIISAVAVFGMAAPHFWLGLVLIFIFAVRLRVLPGGRMGGIDHYVLPVLVLSAGTMAGMTRLLRSTMLEVIDAEYVKMAMIKGVSRNALIWKHCLRNALIPMMSFSGVRFAVLLGGAIVTETIFAWPGAGRLAYQAVFQHDYPLLQTIVLIKSLFIIVVSFIVDITYGLVDPRIRIRGDK